MNYNYITPTGTRGISSTYNNNYYPSSYSNNNPRTNISNYHSNLPSSYQYSHSLSSK